MSETLLVGCKSISQSYFHIDCENGYYSENCNKECGQCAVQKFCEKTTGNCSKGCQAGFEPPLCKGMRIHSINYICFKYTFFGIEENRVNFSKMFFKTVNSLIFLYPFVFQFIDVSFQNIFKIYLRCKYLYIMSSALKSTFEMFK